MKFLNKLILTLACLSSLAACDHPNQPWCGEQYENGELAKFRATGEIVRVVNYSSFVYSCKLNEEGSKTADQVTGYEIRIEDGSQFWVKVESLEKLSGI